MKNEKSEWNLPGVILISEENINEIDEYIFKIIFY
jgi:hypothetical protein